MMADMACRGEGAIDDGDFMECSACGTRIAWDYATDPFWGFAANCERAGHTEQVVGDAVSDARSEELW
jgi:hypothetical protein